MNTHPLADVVSSQYERWMYPQPILDLPAWLTGNWQWFDPSHAHRMFWPDREYKAGMDILVAGCGTNQAAVLAYTNPEAKILAIDVSQPSLNHHQFLKDRYGMNNLELRLLPIEEVASLDRNFDLIVTTGVLHHLADPKVGMKSLAACLRPEGVIATMLYARYGRIGVEMMQSVFRELGLRQNDTSVLMVKDALAVLPPDHPVKSYMSIAPDLQFDAGLVDTFLHGRDRSYTVPDCLDLVTSAGLVFQDLFLKAPYYPPQNHSSAFYHSVAALPVAQQWAIMEQINFRNACHFFTARHKDSSPESYKIDFETEAALDYIPSLRYRCTTNGRQISRQSWNMNLDAVQSAFVEQMDGYRTIGEIAAAARPHPAIAMRSQGEADILAKNFFQTLWRLDILAVSLTAP